MMTTRDLILKTAALPTGFCATNLPHGQRNSASCAAKTLGAEGLLFSSKPDGKRVVWFTSRQAADAAVGLANAENSAKREQMSIKRSRLKPAANAPSTLGPSFKGVQVCPGFEPRFQSGTSVSFGMQRGRVMR
jgi:hypothetical protein